MENLGLKLSLITYLREKPGLCRRILVAVPEDGRQESACRSIESQLPTKNKPKPTKLVHGKNIL